MILLVGGYFEHIRFAQYKLSEQKPEDLSQEEVVKDNNGENTLSQSEEQINLDDETLNSRFDSANVLVSAVQFEQGDTFVVTVENISPEEKITGEFDGQSFDFFPIGIDGKKIGIVGIDARKTPGDYSLSVSIPGRDNTIKTITIKKRNFPVTELALTPELEEKGYTPSNIVENISTNEGVLIWQVLEKYNPKSYFDKPFVYPLDLIVNVGGFGNIRKEGEVTLRHLGTDLDAVIGTPIYAINDGIVSFVQELTVYGKIIIIDHGLGIYSLYLHLNEFKVAKGDNVIRGEVIGLSGNTGYSLGPHLHFSIKAKGSSVDPLRFIDTVNSILK
ncbi:MAG: M23 family metallopeptidase [Candidatus Paceibacterota bacterium]